jgi:tetratricopeptide (TPR) repeat protein
MSRAVVLAPDSAATLDGLQAGPFNDVAEVLAAGGRVTEAVGAVSLRVIGFAGDSVGGVIGLMPKGFYAEYARFLTEAHYALDSAQARQGTRDWLESLHAGGLDSTRFDAVVSNASWAVLAAYLTSRDTVPLAALNRAQDSTASASWRVVRALLALERGDTAEARRRIARDWATPADAEFQGIFGIARGAAWADLLTRLGRDTDAIRTYEILDTVPAVRGGLLVRAWAELGTLYQRTGDVQRAAAAWRRVIDAWRDGDPAYREFARRAETALRNLEASTTRPRT